jgi:hypothetical protein
MKFRFWFIEFWFTIFWKLKIAIAKYPIEMNNMPSICVIYSLLLLSGAVKFEDHYSRLIRISLNFWQVLVNIYINIPVRLLTFSDEMFDLADMVPTNLAIHTKSVRKSMFGISVF